MPLGYSSVAKIVPQLLGEFQAEDIKVPDSFLDRGKAFVIFAVYVSLMTIGWVILETIGNCQWVGSQIIYSDGNASCSINVL